MYTDLEKKQIRIFLIIAYGITCVMGLLMWYGNINNIDVSAFPNAQMMYPAAGVMLAYLLTDNTDKKIPKWFFRIFVLLTIIMIILSVASIIMPDEIVIIAGTGVSLWILGIQYTIIIGSIICWVLYFIMGREKRLAYGLCWKNGKSSLFCIVLFIALYLLRTILSYAVSGSFTSFLLLFSNLYTWAALLGIILNFFFVFIAFLGEEYGWRYYLQPLLQRKFGLRGGVIILGIVWGLWHLPVDFFYYSPGSGLAAAAAQQITCITLGIFFAYAYMKTNNIWVPVILHFLNNNLIAVFAGNYSSDILQNQSISWSELPFALLVNGLIFGGFLAAKEFRQNK